MISASITACSRRCSDLLSDYLKTEFAILDRISTPDPMGGVIYTYQEGAHFFGGLVTNNTTEMRIAQQTGARSLYTIVVDKKIVLDRDQHIRRMEDGASFRLMTDTRDMTTPEKSRLKFSQATVERVVL